MNDQTTAALKRLTKGEPMTEADRQVVLTYMDDLEKIAQDQIAKAEIIESTATSKAVMNLLKTVRYLLWFIRARTEDFWEPGIQKLLAELQSKMPDGYFDGLSDRGE